MIYGRINYFKLSKEAFLYIISPFIFFCIPPRTLR